MSRIGRKPVPVPEAVTVEIAPGNVAVKGPKGELTQVLSPDMAIEQADGVITVARPTDRGEHRALHGLTRSLIANMVEGVTDGFEKQLEIQGVGYRAQLKGKNLEMALGYSHPVTIEAPDGIEFEVCWIVPAALLTDEVRGAAKTARPLPLDLPAEIARYGAETRGGVGISLPTPA